MTDAKPDSPSLSTLRSSVGPTLSVIVPVRNAPDVLDRCLAALADSHYSDFEVLVVDDGSTMPLEPLVTRRHFRYLRIDEPGGPARARNRGAQHARGEYLVFIDSDVCVHGDTLLRFAQAFQTDPYIDAVMGTYDDAPFHTDFFSQYKNLYHHYVHQNCEGLITTFWTGCGAIRREVFVEIGGFDEQHYRRPTIEDIDLGTRVSIAGHRIVLDPRIQCKHLKRWTFGSLLKSDIFDRGIPWTRLMHLAGGFTENLNVKRSQRICVVLVYLALVTSLALVWTPRAWFALAGLVATVTLVNLDFYRFFTGHRGWWFTLRVIPMHWLYFTYCGICAIVGTALYYLNSDRDLRNVQAYRVVRHPPNGSSPSAPPPGDG